MLDKKLLKKLVCPKCHHQLVLDSHDRLICPHDQIEFPVRDGIPVLLTEEATPI